MKLSKLIKQLTDIQKEHGDMDIFLTDQGGNEMEILNVDYNCDYDGDEKVKEYVYFDLA